MVYVYALIHSLSGRAIQSMYRLLEFGLATWVEANTDGKDA